MRGRYSGRGKTYDTRAHKSAHLLVTSRWPLGLFRPRPSRTRVSERPARAMTITKERFLLVRCTPLGEQKLPAAAQVVQASIRDSVQENFGDFGVGCILTLLQVRHYSSDTGLLLVRVAREHAAMLRAALTLVCFVSNQPVRLTAISAAGVPAPALCIRRRLQT